MIDLGRDASDVETSAAEGAALLDAGCLEAELRGFDGGDVAAGAAADDDDVVFLRSRSRSESPEGEGVPDILLR